jgi:hypothetical protein
LVRLGTSLSPFKASAGDTEGKVEAVRFVEIGELGSGHVDDE